MRLEARSDRVRLAFPDNPELPSLEAGWATTYFRHWSALEAMSSDSLCPEWEGAACTAPWDVTFRVRDDFVPGGLFLGRFRSG